MNKLENNKVVVIGQRTVKVGDVLPGLVQLPADSILNYFSSLGLMFPRIVRIDALKEVLTPYVDSSEEMNKLSDEMQYRLRWYETFSEAQLINLLSVFPEKEVYPVFKEELWLNIFEFMLEKQVDEDNFNRLFDLAISLKNTPVLQELNAKEYNDILNPLFYDEENMIDGLTQEIFRPVLYKCSTLEEVRDVGKKYGVNVPRRLRKKELVEIIKEELKDRDDLSEETETKIDKMNVISLQRFAINKKIKVSIELKKEEIIEYILKNAHQTKKKYFKPQTGSYEIFDEDDYIVPTTAPKIEVKEEKEQAIEPEIEPEEEVEEEVEVEETEEIAPFPDLEEETDESEIGYDEQQIKVEEEPKKEIKEVYVSSESISKEETDKIITEIKRVSELVEELKDATYLLSEDERDKLESKIDFTEKHGFEGNTRLGKIKDPIMISPYKIKVSEKNWRAIKKKKEKPIKVKKRIKQRPPIPVVIMEKPEEI